MRHTGNLVGQKFPYFTIIERVIGGYKCLCKCGNEFIEEPYKLVGKGNNGKLRQSCGCLMNNKCLAGQKFGKLTAIIKTKKPENRKEQKHWAWWLCRCDCGKEIVVGSQDLKRWKRSCGCTTNRGKKKEKSAKWKGCGEISSTFWTALCRGAKKRNIVINMTIQDAWNLFLKQERKCALSNIELKFAESNKNFNINTTASLDRIDSNKGYELGNIQWVHKQVNLMKHLLTKEELLNWCKLILEHNGFTITKTEAKPVYSTIYDME